jgi:hypothetical protein
MRAAVRSITNATSDEEARRKARIWRALGQTNWKERWENPDPQGIGIFAGRASHECAGKNHRRLSLNARNQVFPCQISYISELVRLDHDPVELMSWLREFEAPIAAVAERFCAPQGNDLTQSAMTSLGRIA